MAINLSGSNDVNCGQPAIFNINPQSSFTLSCWMRTNTSSNTGTLICRGDSGTRQYQQMIGGSGTPYDLECNIGGGYNTSNNNAGDGLWHHCATVVAYTGSAYQSRNYLDGVALGSLVNAGSSTIASVDTLIGARRATANTGRGYPLTGQIIDSRIYNRSLSEDEIRTIFECRGHDGIVDGLIARWPLNELAPGVTAISCIDVSDNKNHGTPQDGPTYYEDVISFRRVVSG